MWKKPLTALILGSSLLLAGCGVTINTAQGGGNSASSSSPAPSHPVSPSPVATTSSTPAPSHTVSLTSTVTLPVTIIPTSFGGSASYFHYPSSITVTVPTPYASQIQAVGGADFVIISPKGWQGIASEGADGSRSVTLFPPGGSPQPGGPRILVGTDGGCVGCAWSSAAPYFAWVRAHVSQAGYPYVLHDLYPVATYHQSPTLHDYAYVSTRTGLHVNGIAYAPFITHPQGNIYYRGAQTIFPAGEHALATVILNNLEAQFIQQN